MSTVFTRWEGLGKQVSIQGLIRSPALALGLRRQTAQSPPERLGVAIQICKQEIACDSFCYVLFIKKKKKEGKGRVAPKVGDLLKFRSFFRFRGRK